MLLRLQPAPMTNYRQARLFLRTWIDAGGEFAAKANARIIVRLQESSGPVCLRVKLTTDSKDLTKIYLPVRIGHADIYMAGMSIACDREVGAKRTLQFILPAGYAGRRIRVDPIRNAGRLADLTIETGTTN